jgi:hypothetical protein
VCGAVTEPWGLKAGEWITEARRQAGRKVLFDAGWSYVQVTGEMHLVEEDIPRVPRLIAELVRGDDPVTYHWTTILGGILHDMWDCRHDPETGELTQVHGLYFPPGGAPHEA